MGTKDYALGHAEDELVRLGTQADVIDPIFRRTLLEAGIAPGMRILDIGCGPGYVSTLLADMIGTEGEIVGVDISATALETARMRVGRLGLKNVRFELGDPGKMAFDRSFDAVVGRYILMFLPDPAAMLRAISRHLRPGGVLAFHEVAWGGARSFPPAPLFDTCCRWLAATVVHLNADPEMGMKLPATFAAAGIPCPAMRIEQQIGGGEKAFETVRLIVDLIRTQMDSVVASGVATEAEVGIDTLMERVMREIAANGSTVAGRGEVGAWARLAG
jgi:SAM-dependent methyltransferase